MEAAETEEDRRGIADGVQSGDIATVGIGSGGGDGGGSSGSGGVKVGYVSAAATPWPIDSMLQAATSSSQTDDARLDPEESHAPSC